MLTLKEYTMVEVVYLGNISDPTSTILEEETGLIGPPKLTKYEKARVVGARALQLAMGAPVLVKLPPGRKWTPISIALYELEKGVLPITIRRRLPNGSYQDIPLKRLLGKS